MPRRRKNDPAPPPAPGWDAITTAAARVHPGVKPVHVASTAGVGLGGHLDGISAYAEGGTWHLVTYGLTELWAKESEDAKWSGWGYEFTLRVPDHGGSPPDWAYKLLAAVAGVTQQGTVFGPGHRLATGGPITGSGDTLLSSVAFTLDPDLGMITTPNGRVDFLMMVGVTPRGGRGDEGVINRRRARPTITGESSPRHRPSSGLGRRSVPK